MMRSTDLLGRVMEQLPVGADGGLVGADEDAETTRVDESDFGDIDADVAGTRKWIEGRSEVRARVCVEITLPNTRRFPSWKMLSRVIGSAICRTVPQIAVSPSFRACHHDRLRADGLARHTTAAASSVRSGSLTRSTSILAIVSTKAVAACRAGPVRCMRRYRTAVTHAGFHRSFGL